MSEIGEMSPQGVALEQLKPQPRLEDMPEFQKLTPEQQEKLLSLRERMQAEAMSPQHVVTRSIDEMGFFEGLKETVKPHLKAQKEIMFKELKANASLALSLIPVLGEGKGLGTGLLGITVKKGEAVEKAIKFEPFVRLKKAGEYAKSAYHSGRSVNQIVKHTPVANEVATLIAHVRPEKAYKAPGRIKSVIQGEMRKAKDIFSILTSPLNIKHGALSSLGEDFSKSAGEGAKIMATKLGVDGIQVAQHAKAIAKAEAYIKVKQIVAGKNAVQSEWWKFPARWARSAKGEIVGRLASIKAGKEAGKQVTIEVARSIPGYKKGVERWVEGGVKRAAPTAIEATKFGKFHAFFDRWLNLTPDVPVWLSTTTGVMEFLGAHGIDAVPAVMQMGIDRYQQIKVSKDMALDVLAYTAKRGMRKIVERQGAVEVFPTSSTPEAGLRGASSI